jgi:hypothetical protein
LVGWRLGLVELFRSKIFIFIILAFMLKYIKHLLFAVLFLPQLSAQIIDTAFYNTPDSLFTDAELYTPTTMHKFGNNRVVTCDIVNYNINTGATGDFFQLDVYMSRFYNTNFFSNPFVVPINFGSNGAWPKVNIRTILNKSGKKLIVFIGKIYIINLEGIELDFQNTGFVNLNNRVDSIPIPITVTGFSKQVEIAVIGDTLIYYPKYSDQFEINNTLSLFNINTKAQLNIPNHLLYRIKLPQDVAYNDVQHSIKDIQIVNNTIKILVGKVYKNKTAGAPASLPVKQEEDYLITTQLSPVVLKDSTLINNTVLNTNVFGIQEDYFKIAPLNNKQFICGKYDTLLNTVSKNLNLFSGNSDNYSFSNPVFNYVGNSSRTISDFEYHNGLLYLHMTFSNAFTSDSLIIYSPISNKIIYRKRLETIYSGRGVFALGFDNNRLRVHQYNAASAADKYFVILPSFPFPKDLNQKCLGKTGTIELEAESQNSTFNFQWKNPSNLILPGTTKTSIQYQTNGALVGDTLIMTYTTARGLVGTNRFYYSFQPEAVAPADTVIYCNPKKKLLKAKNVNLTLNDYKWDRLIVNNRFNLFDTINAVDTGSYRLTVIRKSNSCANYDTVKVNPDFIPAIGSVLPNQKLFISCKDTITNVFGTTNKARAKLYWKKANGAIKYSNPLKTKLADQYFIVTLDTVNGCKDSSVSAVILNKKITPNASVVGSSNLITTLTCATPSITFLGTSTTAGTLLKWKDNNNVIYNNPITISTGNGFKLIVTDTALGCIDSSQLWATVLNKAKPQFLNFQKQRFITCDDVSIAISATTTLSGQTSISWTNVNNTVFPNPFNTGLPGQYFVKALDNTNGCSNFDTVTVTLIPTLKFTVSNDTTICRGGTASLKATYKNPLNYTWSNGATSSTINVQPATNTTYIVTGIKTSNGCAGKDTITVSIADTVAIAPLAFKPCDPVSTTGTIKVNATGGIPPLKYSINNGVNYFTNNSFNNTPFGTYAIVVKDNIGCTYNSSVTLNSTSSLPIPNFIVPSNAVKGDTIVFVDITDPRPDSVHWTFPANIQLVNDTNKFSPVVVVKEIGSGSVTVTAFYPGCQVPFTRTFNFGAVDTNFANVGNNNGIESVSVSPNPNNGVFDLEIKLYKKQNFAIFINNITTNFSQQLPTQIDSKYFLQNITLNTTTPGTYVVRVIAEYGAKQIKFVVN